VLSGYDFPGICAGGAGWSLKALECGCGRRIVRGAAGFELMDAVDTFIPEPVRGY